MRRAALLGALALALALPSTAAAWYSIVDLGPARSGAGAVLSLEVSPPKTHPGGVNHNYDGLELRLARGTTVDPRAVAGRCTAAQAADRDCPDRSRVGGGFAHMSGARGPYNATVDLYLAPRERAGDAAALVLIARAGGRASHTTGRVVQLRAANHPGYGLQLRFVHLRDAFGQHSNLKGHLNRLAFHLAGRRTVDGQEHHLFENPSTCPSEGWPWRIWISSEDFDGGWFDYGSVDCSG